MVHVGLTETLFQFVGGAERTDLAVHHDRDSVAIFGLVHIVSGHKDGNATLGSIANQLPELASRGRVYAARWFVEEHHARLMEYRYGEGEFLFPAQGERRDEVVFVLGKAQPLEQFVGLAGNLLVAHAVDAGKEAYVLGNGQILVERKALRHVADVALYLFVLGADVIAHNGATAAGGLVQSGQHVHGGCLSCTVSPEEPEDFSALHRERDIVDGTERAEGLDQMAHLDDVVVCAGGIVLGMFKTRRIEHIGETAKDDFGGIDSTNAAMVEKRHPLAAPHLVKIGRRGHDGDTSFFQHAKHVP